MKNDKIYKVYMHKNKINNKIYIGLTKQEVEKRWRNGSTYKRSKILYNAIQKYGWENFEHIILYENLSKEEAEQKEIELIAQYKSNQRKYGYNIESGGNANKEISLSTRIKQSINNGRYWKNKHLPKEIKDKISKAKKGTRFGNSLLVMKKVNQYDLNGKFIKQYDYIKQTALELNIPYQNISMCCRNIIHKTHGYIFKYAEQMNLQGQ